MGKIRNGHNACGIYSKLMPYVKREPSGSLNSYSSGKPTETYDLSDGEIIKRTVYYGYLPIITKNGQPMPDVDKYIKIIDSKETLEKTPTLFKQVMSRTMNVLNNGKNIEIPKEINTTENSYFNDVDKVNKGFVLVVNKNTLKTKKIRFFDNLLYTLSHDKVDVLNKFITVRDIYIDGSLSTILFAIDKNFAYSPCGVNKVISPLLVEVY